jgi:hypothetical protein
VCPMSFVALFDLAAGWRFDQIPRIRLVGICFCFYFLFIYFTFFFYNRDKFFLEILIAFIA